MDEGLGGGKGSDHNFDRLRSLSNRLAKSDRVASFDGSPAAPVSIGVRSVLPTGGVSGYGCVSSQFAAVSVAISDDRDVGDGDGGGVWRGGDRTVPSTDQWAAPGWKYGSLTDADPQPGNINADGGLRRLQFTGQRFYGAKSVQCPATGGGPAGSIVNPGESAGRGSAGGGFKRGVSVGQ